MKMRALKISVVLLLVMLACRPCKPVIIDRGPLSEELLNKIPYKTGEYVSFKHSNGYNINFSVNSQTTKESFQEDFRSCRGLIFEKNTTTLTPNYPIFKFQLSISNADSLHNPVFVNIGRFGFMIADSSNQWGPVDIADSLMINGFVYDSVYRMKYDDSFYQDDLIYVDSLLYNTDFGILKVVMTNGEYYARNK
jgi:hypothetical protein